METVMLKSLIKSMAIYAVIFSIMFGTGKMLTTGISAMIDTARDMNDAVNYAVVAIVDDDDVQ